MSNPSILGAVEWEAETDVTGFNQNVSTFTTGQIGLLDRVDITGLSHPKIDPARVVQYRGEGTTQIQGPKSGKFKTRIWLTGHGSTCAGAVSLTPTETLLGYVFGTAEVAAASGSTFTGGTATVPTTTASGTFSARSIMRAGAIGDGRGGGQFYPIATHSGTSMTLLADMIAAPSNGDVLYSPIMIYEKSDPTATYIRGVRMRTMGPNLIHELHGCHAESVTFSGFNAGQQPYAEITWDVGEWFVVGSVTNPSVVAAVTDNPGTVAGGSFHFQDVGTTTRSAIVYRDLSITYNLATVREEGPGSAFQFATKTGARRMHPSPAATVQFTLDADAQTATPTFDAAFLAGTTRKNGMLTLSTGDGSALGFFWRSLCWAGSRPTQMDGGGKNVRQYTLYAHTGATLTTDLSRAAQVMVRA